MSGSHRIAPIVAVTGTSLMVGCYGNDGYYYGSCGSYGYYGSYGSYAACPGPYGYHAGMYAGSLRERPASQGQTVISIIAENGDGRMSGGNDTYYRLKVNTARSNLSGTFTGYSQSGSLPNGTHIIAGSITGVATRANLNAILSGSRSTQSLALTFENAHHSGSSLTTLAGNWTSTSNGITLTATIQPDGSFIGLDSNNCTYAGAFSLIDAKFNVYAETHLRTCGGVNVTFAGLAAFVPGTGTGVTGTPTQIKLLADNNAGEYVVAALQ
jgi:hypothetical protein